MGSLWMSVDKLNQRHWNYIRTVFQDKAAELKRLARKHTHSVIDPDVALRNVFDAEHAYIVDGYLVVYEISTLWWSDDPIISEQLVFALEPNGDFSSVIRFFEAKAREVGARWIQAGTALAKSDRALASIYQRYGFEQHAIGLSKEIT